MPPRKESPEDRLHRVLFTGLVHAERARDREAGISTTDATGFLLEPMVAPSSKTIVRNAPVDSVAGGFKKMGGGCYDFWAGCWDASTSSCSCATATCAACGRCACGGGDNVDA